MTEERKCFDGSCSNKHREYDLRADLEQDIKLYLSQIDHSNSNLHFDELEAMFEYEGDKVPGYFILTLNGGLNGRGNVLFYLEDLEKLIKKLMIRFDRVWMIDYLNDCPDDLFTVRLGMAFNE